MTEAAKYQLEGLNYALNLVKGRHFLSRPPGYLAAMDGIKIFLEAAIERVENGQSMNAGCDARMCFND